MYFEMPFKTLICPLNQKHSLYTPAETYPLQAVELNLKPLIFWGVLAFETSEETWYEESDASLSKQLHLAFPFFLQQK